MERNGLPVTEYPVRTIATGITFRRFLPGVVPELEEREAARFNGYTWKEWQALPHLERVDCVAYYRLAHFIDLNQQEAQAREAERQARRRRSS